MAQHRSYWCWRLVTGHLELAVKMVALMIGLLTITVGALVSPMTGLPIPIDKTTSSDLTDLQH